MIGPIAFDRGNIIPIMPILRANRAFTRVRHLPTCRSIAFILSITLLVASARSEFPEKPIKIIIPTNTGGEVDTMARIFQRALQQNSIIPVKTVILNLPGAGGTLGTRRLKESPPDGYTIGLWTPGIVTSKTMGIVTYDHSDFAIIGRTGYSELALGVLNSSKYDSIESLIAQSKERPRSVKVATNIGLPVHLTPLMFAEGAGIEFNFVQTGGGSKRLASILGKHTDLSLFSLLEFIKFGSTGLTPLVVLSNERTGHFPDVPTAKELGVDLVMNDARIWIAPKDTPPERIEYIANALKSVMALPEIIEEYKTLGIYNEFGEPEEIDAFLDNMSERVAPLVAKARKL